MKQVRKGVLASSKSGNSFLLDTYTAAFAISLRQLKTGVTNVVRVRRSSDNAEQDFTPTEITDGTLTTFTGAGDGFIVTWYDQSGNSADVTQATAGSQPKIVSSGSVITKGSLPAVDFLASSSQYLTRAAISALDNGTEFSFFSVSSGRSTGQVSGLLSTDPSGDRITVFHDTRTTPTRNLFVDTTVSTFTADLSTARNNTNQRLVSSFCDSGLNISDFDDGATGGTDTVTGDWGNNILDIGRQNVGGVYMDGQIQEFIIFGSDQSANRVAIETEINGHYSIF